MVAGETLIPLIGELGTIGDIGDVEFGRDPNPRLSIPEFVWTSVLSSETCERASFLCRIRVITNWSSGGHLIMYVKCSS